MPLWLRKLRTRKGIRMPKVGKKKFPYTKKGKADAKNEPKKSGAKMLTGKQKNLPDFMKEKIMKSKTKKK